MREMKFEQLDLDGGSVPMGLKASKAEVEYEKALRLAEDKKQAALAERVNESPVKVGDWVRYHPNPLDKRSYIGKVTAIDGSKMPLRYTLVSLDLEGREGYVEGITKLSPLSHVDRQRLEASQARTGLL